MNTFLRLFFFWGLLVCVSCTSESRETDSSKAAPALTVEDATVDSFSRPYFEKKLADLNIPLYDDVRFDTLRQRRYNDGYEMRYIIPPGPANTLRKVRNYYLDAFNTAAEKHGLERLNIDRTIILTRDGEHVVSVTAMEDTDHILLFVF
ncbi:MAG: hypothetical protein ACQEQ4_08330 [Fibrobacterota bacterium]